MIYIVHIRFYYLYHLWIDLPFTKEEFFASLPHTGAGATFPRTGQGTPTADRHDRHGAAENLMDCCSFAVMLCDTMSSCIPILNLFRFAASRLLRSGFEAGSF